MIAKKVKNVLFTLATGVTILGIVLFVLIPMICGESFAYDGLNSLLAGLKLFISFDFNNTAYVFIFVLTLIMILCLVWWMIILISKKAKGSIAQYIVTFLLTCCIMTVASTYFVAKTTFNGEEVNLFKAIIALHGQEKLGMWLSLLVIGMMYVGLMLFTLFAFIDIYQVIVGFPKDRIVEVKVPCQPEVAPVAAVEKVDDDLDDRRAREEALFAGAQATGDFEIYEEWEVEPLEGFTEEPVVDEIEIQETTTFHKPTKNVVSIQVIKD